MREQNRRSVKLYWWRIGRPSVVVMRPVSIVKIVVSASVFIAAGSAALVFGVAQEERLAAVAGTPTTSVPQPPPALSSDARPASTETSPTHAATALAATEARAVAAELAGPPEADSKNQFSPSFDIARVEAGGDAVIAGRAAPGATVDLLRGGQRLDQADADASGQFVIVPPRLPAGSYELTLSAKFPDGTVTLSKHGVSVTVNEVGPSPQSHAEYVSETASQPRPPSEPPLRTGDPQEKNAGLQAAHPIHATPAADEGSSSPAVAHAISSKVVSRGDSLWRISRVTYGDGARYALVYRANRDRVRDPNFIYPGQTLVLPVKRN